MRLLSLLSFLAIYGQLHAIAQRIPHFGSESPSIPEEAPVPKVPSEAGSGEHPISPIYGAPAPNEHIGADGSKASEPDIGDAIQSLLDAITSVVSEVQGDSTITSAAPLPTAAYPCLDAESAYNDCRSHSTGFVSAPMSAQASCLCYNNASSWSPDRFDGYLSGCDRFVQAQATVSAAGNLSTGLGLCTSAGDVLASASASSASKASVASSTSIPIRAPTTGMASGRVRCGSSLVVLGGILLGSAFS